MPRPTVNSGRTLIPGVSSSKNLRSPALDAGNGAFFFFFWLIECFFHPFPKLPFTLFPQYEHESTRFDDMVWLVLFVVTKNPMSDLP